MHTIFVVDDDFDVLSATVRALKNDFTIIASNSPQAALSYLRDNDVSAIVSDVSMPDLNGFELQDGQSAVRDAGLRSRGCEHRSEWRCCGRVEFGENLNA